MDFFDEEIRDQVKAVTKKVFEEGQAEIEVTVVNKSGQRILYYLNGFAVNYEGKHCLLGAGIDLSARENAQKEIRKNQEKYRSLFEQASDPILITDFKGNFSDVNGSFCKLFGYTKRELLKMNITSLICPQQLRERPMEFEPVIKGKHVINERRMMHKDGSMVETEANVKKFGEDGQMAIVRDVTVIRKLQRRMEEERMEQKEQEQKKITRAVIKAQEIERNLIGRELHDNVNQLLASARMCLSTAKRTPAGKKEFVNTTIRMIDDAISEIRLLSKKHVTPQNGFLLKEQIQSLVKVMGEGIGFKIEFEYEIPGTRELLEDLKLNIYRIIQEQLNNVYKHASASRARIHMYAKNNLIHISITDDGIGFEVGIKKSGVGIVNIINRVESYNGHVSFNTKPGVGCKLDIRIPMIFQ